MNNMPNLMCKDYTEKHVLKAVKFSCLRIITSKIKHTQKWLMTCDRFKAVKKLYTKEQQCIVKRLNCPTLITSL